MTHSAHYRARTLRKSETETTRRRKPIQKKKRIRVRRKATAETASRKRRMNLRRKGASRTMLAKRPLVIPEPRWWTWTSMMYAHPLSLSLSFTFSFSLSLFLSFSSLFLFLTLFLSLSLSLNMIYHAVAATTAETTQSSKAHARVAGCLQRLVGWAARRGHQLVSEVRWCVMILIVRRSLN